MARAERGDVWQVDFGLAAKVRPALLLTGEPEAEDLDLFTVLLHTTAADAGKYPLRNHFSAQAHFTFNRFRHLGS